MSFAWRRQPWKNLNLTCLNPIFRIKSTDGKNSLLVAMKVRQAYHPCCFRLSCCRIETERRGMAANCTANQLPRRRNMRGSRDCWKIAICFHRRLLLMIMLVILLARHVAVGCWREWKSDGEMPEGSGMSYETGAGRNAALSWRGILLAKYVARQSRWRRPGIGVRRPQYGMEQKKYDEKPGLGRKPTNGRPPMLVGSALLMRVIYRPLSCATLATA